MSRRNLSRRNVVCSIGVLLVVIAIVWSARTVDLMTMLRRMHGM